MPLSNWYSTVSAVEIEFAKRKRSSLILVSFLFVASFSLMFTLNGVAAKAVDLLGIHNQGSNTEQSSSVEGQHRSVHDATRIAYAGVVPYRVHRSRSKHRAVACGGGSSVECVVVAAENGLHKAMEGAPAGPGKLAVEEAAKGRGFAPWHVAHQSKAARNAARHALAVSSGNGHGRLSPPYSLIPSPHTHHAQ